MKIYIKNANGYRICIARREGKYRLSKLDIGVIEDSFSPAKIAFNDGYYVQEDALFLGKRNITIGFSNYADTTTEFVRTLHPKFMLEITFEDRGIRRKIYGKTVGTPQIARDRTRYVEFNVECFDPFFRGTEEKTNNFEGRICVNNGGDVECPFRLEISGYSISSTKGVNPVLTSETCGVYVAFENINLMTGDKLEADSSMDARSIVVTRSDGTVENGYNYLTLAEKCRLFDLVSGDNILSCKNGEEDWKAKINFSERYLDWGVVI